MAKYLQSLKIPYICLKIWNNYLIYSLYKSFLQERASKCSLDVRFGMKQNRKCGCKDRMFCAKNASGVRVNFSAHSASITTIFWNDIHKYIDYNVLIFHNVCSRADGDNEVYLGSRLPTTQILPPPSFQQKSRPYIANKNHTKKGSRGTLIT